MPIPSLRTLRRMAASQRHENCRTPILRIYKKSIDPSGFCIYTKFMDIEFDPAKNEANIASKGLSFEDFAGFDVFPFILEDTRFDYREVRYQAFGRIGGEGHMIVFTLTATGIRLISFRRCHEKEMRRYE